MAGHRPIYSYICVGLSHKLIDALDGLLVYFASII